MTAIVGILNRRGAVVAADSAVTVNGRNGNKTYNTATKIFPLSNQHPVGVMIFSSASFMGTPWDIIFKLYLARKGDQPFNSLKECADDFLLFLKNEGYFAGNEIQKEYFCSEISSFYYSIKEVVASKMEELVDEDENCTAEQLFARYKAIILEELRRNVEEFKEHGMNPEFTDYTLSMMRSYAKENLDDWEELRNEEQLPEGMRDEWENGFYEYLKSTSYINGTGIVFVGYGKNDIYPALLSVYVSGAFDRRLRYYYEENDACIINPERSAFIIPFAQEDVMQNLMRGIHPAFRQMISATVRQSTEKAKMKLAERLREEGVSEDIIQRMIDADLEDISNDFDEQVEAYSQSEFVSGIVDAVDSFNLEDMASMAESLIEVTNLQRHISSSEETVGGPVDVAVITRTDGFMWVKHKQWPPKENI